jgi:hypothetical protein
LGIAVVAEAARTGGIGVDVEGALAVEGEDHPARGLGLTVGGAHLDERGRIGGAVGGDQQLKGAGGGEWLRGLAGRANRKTGEKQQDGEG